MKFSPGADHTPHFNRLSPDVAERLEILGEEATEILQILAKIKRHGFESHHPNDPTITNRKLLEKEIGHFELMLTEMLNFRDVDACAINDAAKEKRSTINRWLHHNQFKTN